MSKRHHTSFSVPEAELGPATFRAARLGVSRSKLCRAGLVMAAAATDAEILEAVGSLPVGGGENSAFVGPPEESAFTTTRARRLGVSRSRYVRAGLRLVAAASDEEVRAALDTLPPDVVATWRPPRAPTLEAAPS